MGNWSWISSHGATGGNNGVARSNILIHGPISWLHTSAYRCRPARLQANKLDCSPDICNPAPVLTKVGSTLSYVGRLTFITQIPVGLCGGATFGCVAVISAAFHGSSSPTCSQTLSKRSILRLHRGDWVWSNLMDAFSGKYDKIGRAVKQQPATPLLYRQFTNPLLRANNAFCQSWLHLLSVFTNDLSAR